MGYSVKLILDPWSWWWKRVFIHHRGNIFSVLCNFTVEPCRPLQTPGQTLQLRFQWRRSGQSSAAVNIQHRAGDIAVGYEKNNRFGDFIRPSNPLYFFTVWITNAEYDVVSCFSPGGPQGSAHITDSNYCDFHVVSSFIIV